MIQNSDTDDPSIGTLLKDLTDRSRTLLRQEVELAKAEMGEKVSTIGRNIGYLAIGGAVLYAGVLALIATACIGVAVAFAQAVDGKTAAWLGPLLVGVLVCIAGYALVRRAIATLKKERIVPQKTIESLRENTEWFKDQMTASANRMTRDATTIR